MDMTRLLVRKDDLATTELRRAPLPEPGDGQALLAIERFAVTANNITYGVVGDAMGYWNFFPGGDGWGAIPVWGFATVARSRHPGLADGERVYGYLPMASHVLVEPTRVGAAGFTDGAAHRQPMSAIYNQYVRLGAEPGDDAREDLRALFEPLFTTSFLIEDVFRRADWHGAERLVATSASSKTAMALAHVARAKSPEIERVALTSEANAAFVADTGLWDAVLTYDAIETFGDTPAVSVDFAGNGGVLARVHRTLGAALQYSCLVGVTHWQGRGGASDLPGPKPILFFAPTAAETLIGEIGAEAFQAERGAAFDEFATDAAGWVTIEHGEGGAEVERVYRAMLTGEARPEAGYVVGFGKGG